MAASSLYLLSKKNQVKLQERLKSSEPLLSALDAIGKLDALLSLAKYEDKLDSRGVLPKLTEGDSFSASYNGLRSPMRELKEKDSSVPNDLELRAGQLTVLNGPNTGGKSTILLTLCHSQILAQLGTRVVAESAELTVADQIIYQGSESSAGEEHGKFGKELKAFKTSLETASKKSLIILDEVGGGSAEDESRPIIRKTLIAFRDAKGCTIYVTHDRKLARELCQDGAKPLQIGFDQRTGRSTFKLIPGISARSHAEEAAEKVGLTDEFLAEFIKQK